MFLYVTCDKIGNQTGAGAVTANELQALRELGEVDVINPEPNINPFKPELSINIENYKKYKLAHFYAGTFPNLIRKLKENGVKVTFTTAAHDIELSKAEHEKYGMKYDFPHLTIPEFWNEYISSYHNADLLIVPSTHSKMVKSKYGCKNITVIPHGCEEGRNIKYPKIFTVGYLGQIGPDKGVGYLIDAWSQLNYDDAILTFAGSQSPYLINTLRQNKKGNYNILGYVKTIEEFFSQISVYVQPSVTEGFGIETLEAMSYGRPVIASNGAGSSDCLNELCRITQKGNVQQIMSAIDWYKNNKWDYRKELIDHSRKYSWENVRNMYKSIWRHVLGH